MKRLLIIMLLFFSTQAMTQTNYLAGEKVRLDFMGQVFEMDSTDRMSYTEVLFTFKRAKKLQTLSDSTKYISYTTSGNYCVYARFDTVDVLTGATLGDTDSLFMYEKEIDPDGNIVHNDSTFITPDWSTTGFDWEVDKTYKWTFDMDPARGCAIYIKIQRDAGANKVTLWMPL